jgi:hypothetical protein
MKLVYYYQTPGHFDKLLNSKTLIRDADIYILVSSIHFGLDSGKPYIHINDNAPDALPVWSDMTKACSKGMKVGVMLGGAGGAYSWLFSNFEVYYGMLLDIFRSYPVITGIDLDIEEETAISDVYKLIGRLRKDMGTDFTITMAPISSAMIGSGSGLGGFSYKELYNSIYGPSIDWFNVQCYGSASEDTFEKMVKNGYPPKKLVVGMLGDIISDDSEVETTIKNVYKAYPKALGAALWEYGDTHIDPIAWGTAVIHGANDRVDLPIVISAPKCCCAIM